jgi:modulator of FtsH protease
MDPYQQQPWHDYFLATAGASAALAGLLFVAISLHIRYISTDPVYRSTSRGNIIGLVNVLVLSLVALVPQPAGWLGLELVGIAASFILVGGAYELASIRRSAWRIPRSTLQRSGFGYVLAIAGVAAGLSISFRAGPGVYILAFILVVVLLWSLWDAWGLLMGVADEEMAAERKAR